MLVARNEYVAAPAGAALRVHGGCEIRDCHGHASVTNAPAEIEIFSVKKVSLVEAA